MAKQKPLTDQEGTVRELGDADFAEAVAFSKLPQSLRRKVGGRGPQKGPTKERVTIRLSKDVVEAFRSGGPGWQSRMDEELNKTVQNFRDSLASHLTRRLLDKQTDLKTRIEGIAGTLKNAPYPPSVTVQELIEQACLEADEGRLKEAETLIEKAIRKYQQGRYAA